MASFSPHHIYQVLPETEQLHSNDKKFIVMNTSILSAVAVSDATFMGPPVSIIRPLALERESMVNANSHSENGPAWAPEKMVIHQLPLSSRSICIWEA